jgi:3-isopropylmalate/(R)-2-methylmalate dehydratase small subunit
MDPLTTHTGKVMPMDRKNVDTDAILPKQFLKSIRRTGFGEHLFDGLRYVKPAAGEARIPDPTFVLNDPRYSGASVLLARDNFGCGSSREHAVWALQQYGFRVLLAPSFADIFYTNCFKNGVLPIVLPQASIDGLFDQERACPAIVLRVDLERQIITTHRGESMPFDVPPFQKFCLLGGYDEIALTLRHANQIRDFENRRLATRPWLGRARANSEATSS